ncbi:MAG: sugar transferase [Patescibacteria group bacterium]|nr:sugar transferase [Patescibacteria group bacterium]
MLLLLGERLLAFLLLIVFSPVFFVLFFLVRLSSPGPFLFKQIRMGKGKKPFIVYKIRTMIKDAEKLKKNYLHLNQADGPVFKIKNDPRFTPIGKIISQFGLDELPQLINIIRGEMSFVGPRPLPVEEARKIPQEYQKRFLVKPGIFSSWVAQGAFLNDFQRWMILDLQDVKSKSFWYDLKVAIRSLRFVFCLFFSLIFWKKFNDRLSKRPNHPKT